MRTHLSCLLASLLFLVPSLALAQGVLVNVNPGQAVALPRPVLPHHGGRPMPLPHASYKIKELSVNVSLTDQVARTQVTQSFVNTGSVQMEVCFVFPLPYDGAIDQLTLLVDGKEYPARLLPAEEARKTYEEIVRKNRDPALLEWMGSGMFKTSVFPVPPGAERKVTLNYSQLCRKDQGLTDYLFPLATARYTTDPLEKLDIHVTIASGTPIKNVYSPTHTVEIKRPDNQHASIHLSLASQIPTSDFRLMFDAAAGEVGASVLSFRRDQSDDGFFLLLASPQIKAAQETPTAKTVVFVIDRSGSMSGEKLNQAKGAMKFVLNNLHAGDTFNIVAYDSKVESFRPELQRFDDQTRASALGYVDGLFSGGSTNIDGALRAALGQLKDSSRPNFVIFLTDGLPTDGEKNEAAIAVNARSANGVRARLFAFGVGYDVNSRLLDTLARENFGQSEYVRPNENIEARVSSLYARIGSPVMTDTSIQFQFDGAPADSAVNRPYPAKAHDLFAGEQLVVVGRYKKFGSAKIVVQGKVGSQEQKFEFPAQLIEKSAHETNGFIEKLWAIRRVGEIIDELDLKGRNEELIKELVMLSTRHGVLTPYTSFLADETNQPRTLGLQLRSAGESLRQLQENPSGERGVAQRAAKNYLRKAMAPGDSFKQSAPAAGALEPGLSTARNFYFDAKTDKAVAVNTVQSVGSKTFYRRSDRWVDGSLSTDQEKQARKVERFSPEYFELVKQHGKELAQYLNFDEPVIVEIAGVAYSF